MGFVLNVLERGQRTKNENLYYWDTSRIFKRLLEVAGNKQLLLKYLKSADVIMISCKLVFGLS